MFAVIVGVMTACSSGSSQSLAPVPVEIVQSEAGYQLLRDGQPYVIKGAGMVVDDIERFAAQGGNSIRNYRIRGRCWMWHTNMA
jgi:hypothetical protein